MRCACKQKENKSNSDLESTRTSQPQHAVKSMATLHARKKILWQACIVDIGIYHDAAVTVAGEALECFKANVSSADGKHINNRTPQKETFRQFLVV
jgi:hypothetical protein